MLPLAAPTFSGLPDAVVEKVDVYSDVDPNLKNKLASKISAFDTDIDSVISGATKMVKGIGSSLKNNGIDLVTAKQRIQEALGGSRGSISDISEVLEREITGDLTGVDEGTGYVRRANTMIDSVKLAMGGFDRTFKSSDYKNVSGVLGFIRDLSSNQLINVFDLGAEAALIKGVLTEVSSWGIAELVDETFGAKWNSEKNSYDYSYDDEFRFSVTKRASENLSPSTNLSVIESLITHGGNTALIAENPNFPDQLLAGYVLPEGCVPGGPFPVMIPDPNNANGPAIPDPSGAQKVPNYYDQGRRLKRILNILKPSWFYVNRNVFTGNAGNPWRTDVVWNLQYLATASEPARLVLMEDTDLRVAMMTAPFYRMESGIAMLKNMYPYFVETA